MFKTYTNEEFVDTMVEGLKQHGVSFIKNEELAYMVANHSDIKTMIEWDETEEAYRIELIDYITNQYILTFDDEEEGFTVSANIEYFSGKEEETTHEYKSKAGASRKANTYVNQGFEWDGTFYKEGQA